jgi:primosomal protein N' (replication factor Y)
MELAGDIVAALRQSGTGYRVLGPAPAPLVKLRGEHRAQLFMKGSHRAAMRKALQEVLDQQPDLRRSISVDVDPVGML